MVLLAVGILPLESELSPACQWAIWAFGEEEVTFIRPGEKKINVEAFDHLPDAKLAQYEKIIEIGTFNEGKEAAFFLALAQLSTYTKVTDAKSGQIWPMSTLHDLERKSLIFLHVNGWLDLEAAMDCT
ncbi:hypothetical protein N7456_007192 [Penicillium angulare]|uniref:Uncharacterized protein n=1 Tax=Penicillium angulare TaxID=116970 RepID=A0A9W9FJ79_9EURO|nr:hypothetical protein N7456_007192 [Penicillium angulare]